MVDAPKWFRKDAFGVLASIGVIGRYSAPKRTSQEILRHYGELPWLLAAQHKIASTCASIPWKVYVVRNHVTRKAYRLTKAQTAGDPVIRRRILAQKAAAGELEELPSHPILDFLARGSKQPAPGQRFGGLGLTGRQQLYAAYQQVDMTGETVWLLERNGAGMPVAWYVIPPTWVTEIPTPDMPWFVVNNNRFTVKVPAADAIWIKMPNAFDPYARGLGVTHGMGDDLESDELSAKYTRNFYHNGGRPDLIITGDGMDKAQSERLKQSWQERVVGIARKYAPFFLQGSNVQVKEISQDFDFSGIVELRKFCRDQVFQVHGIPPEVMGVIENSNRATIEGADLQFAKHAQVPRVEAMRDALQTDLVPQFDDRIILDYENPVQEDKEHQLNAVRAAPYAFDVDEIRALADHEPIADGNGAKRMVLFTQRFVESLDDDAMPPAPAPAGPAPDPDQERRVKAPVYKQDEITRDEIESILGVILAEDVAEQLMPVVQNTVRDMGRRLFDSLGDLVEIEFNMVDPEVVSFLRETSSSQITRINETTRDAVRAVLSAGEEQGASVGRLADEIAELFEDARGPRSFMIARTESTRAGNFGIEQGMKQAGVERKQWLSTRDGRERETHASMDRQMVRTNERFRSPNGGTAAYPGGFGIAAEDINCRCTILAVIGDRTFDLKESEAYALWKDFDNAVIPHEAAMRSAVRRAFNKQERAVLARLRSL